MSRSDNPRPRLEHAAPPQPRLAPAFDRDALALSYLHSQGHLTRTEFRDNLRMLGLRLNEEEDQRMLAVPKLVRIAPPADVIEAPALEPEPPPEDDEEPWDPWADDETEEE